MAYSPKNSNCFTGPTITCSSIIPTLWRKISGRVSIVRFDDGASAFCWLAQRLLAPPDFRFTLSLVSPWLFPPSFFYYWFSYILYLFSFCFCFCFFCHFYFVIFYFIYWYFFHSFFLSFLNFLLFLPFVFFSTSLILLFFYSLSLLISFPLSFSPLGSSRSCDV